MRYDNNLRLPPPSQSLCQHNSQCEQNGASFHKYMRALRYFIYLLMNAPILITALLFGSAIREIGDWGLYLPAIFLSNITPGAIR